MLFTIKAHRFLFLFGLAISVCALPYSPFALSVGLIMVVVNWILEGLWVDKLERIKHRKALWFFMLVYTSILIGFFYSDNIKYAIKELRLWLPLLVLPIVLATSAPLKKWEFKLLILMFLLAVFVASLISSSIFIRDFLHLSQNVRYISPYISHIRFALMINLSVFLLGYLTFKEGYFISLFIKSLLILAALWFIFFLFVLQSMTGIIIFLIVSVTLIIRWSIKINEPVLKFSLIVGVIFFFLATLSYIAHTVDKYFTRNYVDLKALKSTTVNGNKYTQDTTCKQYENGNLVWINVCYPELRRGWEKLSPMPFDGKDKEGQPIEQTLIRYLASKGLSKDSIGLTKLDSDEIRLIENSVSSIVYREHKAGIYPRLYQLLWEIDSYKTSGVTVGSSFVQRVIFLKASWLVIKNNFLFGVGTGDGKDSLIEYYKKPDFNLDSKYWFISHNQFLTVWIASGIIGLILFLIGLLYPFFHENKSNYFLCSIFLFLILLSMLSEDTLETHIGVSFAALFYSLFFFGYDFSQDESE